MAKIPPSIAELFVTGFRAAVTEADLSLDFHVTDRKMGSFLAEFPIQSKPSEPHQHEGAELLYVIRGQLAVNIDGEDFVLDTGDAMYFNSSAPHSYRREGRTSCSAIVVIAAMSPVRCWQEAGRTTPDSSSFQGTN